MNSTNEVTDTATPANDLSNLSFTDYQKVRRGGEVTTAPVEKSTEQKPANSEPAKAEENEDDLDESDSDELEASKDSENDKPKKKGGFQRRIDKLNARYSAAQAEIERLKALAPKDAGQPKAVENVDTKQADGKPDADNFETHAAYVEALTDWKIEQREKAALETKQKSDLETQYKEKLNSHYEREKSFSSKTPDYAETIKEFIELNPSVSTTLEQLIVESDIGPEIMYALANDDETFKKINALTPIGIAREFGKLELKLSSKPSETKPEPKKLTTAPKPIEPVGKSTSGSISKSLDDPNISFAEYERKRREQMKRR